MYSTKHLNPVRTNAFGVEVEDLIHPFIHPINQSLLQTKCTDI